MRFPRLAPLVLLVGLAAPGRAAELKLSTWNMEWLTLRSGAAVDLPADVVPRQAGDFDRLRWYAGVLDADVVALEEVDGPAAAARIFPANRYVLHFTGDTVVQRVGFAVRRGIEFTANPDLTALDVYGPEAPHALRSGADITLHLAGGRTLRLLAVHLKTGCWDRALSARPRACRVLAAQLRVLRGWVAARAAEGVAFAVLGDFNRVMGADDGFIAGLRAAAPLVETDAGAANPCWGGSDFIDHVLLGGAARGWLVPDSLRVLVYRETDAAAREHISDHCPVSVRLNEK